MTVVSPVGVEFAVIKYVNTIDFDGTLMMQQWKNVKQIRRIEGPKNIWRSANIHTFERDAENAGPENVGQRCQVWGTKNAVLENVGLKMWDWKMQDW